MAALRPTALSIVVVGTQDLDRPARHVHATDYDSAVESRANVRSSCAGAHIKTLNSLKATHRTSFPVLTWKMILVGQNRHEIEA
ncbi:MAG: hypothetical protein ACJAZN_002833, partial [Planctomycetota bacterium]